MRTTLTLDDDVAALLLEVIRRERRTLKSVVNEALKRGILSREDKPLNKKYSTQPYDAGRLLAGDLTNIGELLCQIDEGIR